MSENNTTIFDSNPRRRIKGSKHFEGFKLRVFETSRQTKCFRTVCYFERSTIDINFSTYSYNPNSLVSFQFFKQSQFQNQFEYNSRNWITSMNSLQGLFGFTNTYFPNGNVKSQLLFGTYKDHYPQNNYNLNYNFTYDYSNRLLEAVNINQGDLSFSVLNTYDKDGNFTTLKRYGDNNVLNDNFNYQYYSGTNKLSKVSGAEDQYSYDYNGNCIRDTLNLNFNIKYDHRNLITELYHADRGASARSYTYATRYYYDESGSRVRKLEYLNTQTNPPPISNWDNPGNGWTLSNNEFYVKGADGKDLATYQGSELEDWYVWGGDLIGKIRNDKPYYYFKDHLGSVRAIVKNDASVVAAYDYDAWGYPLEGRTFNADSMKFKYTGKELDKESLYDYFGARYYDARIGRWGQVEPKIENTYNFSSYVYCIDNPLRVIDPFGLDWFYSEKLKKWEYIENASIMININYDSESKETTTSIIQGEKEFLGFNGSSLTWYYPKGSIRSWYARSGILDKEVRTQPELQYESQRGPIPEGAYNINPNAAFYYPDKVGSGKLWNIWPFGPDEKTLRSWGKGWTPLKPTRGNNTNRSNFFIHGGLVPGSIGCIDLTGGIDDFLITFMNYGKPLDVLVNY